MAKLSMFLFPGCMEPDAAAFHWRWSHELPNSIKYNLELSIILLFQRCQFACEFNMRREHLAEPYEGLHDLDARLDR